MLQNYVSPSEIHNVTKNHKILTFKNSVNEQIIIFQPVHMDMFPSPQTLLEHSFYLTVRELILLLVVFYQLGYYFGKKRFFSISESLAPQNSLVILSLPCSQNPEVFFQPNSKQEEKVQHSLKLIQQTSSPSSDLPSAADSQSGKGQSQNLPVPKTEEQVTRDFLSEKINVQGKRIQSRGIFHMTFQKAENPKFIRKIEKHEIITDYEVPQTSSSDGQLIPFGSKKLFEFTDESSILEISTYENLRLQKYPIIEKKFIKTHQFAQFEEKSEVNIPMSASLCENGKFNKFFKNQKKIGEGAFGVVYSVKNIFEGKQYAVKKLFIKSGLGKDKMEIILNESIKEVSIISQYSHPNIIRFYTCWLEIANLNESISFNKMHFRQHSQSDYSNLQSGKQLNFKKKKSTEQCVEISYISSQNNSGFAFEGESRGNFSNSHHNGINDQSQQSDCQAISLLQNDGSRSNQQKEKQYSDFIPVFALYIQMELCSEGSLDKYLFKRKYLNRSFSFIVINQLLQGVQYLHSNGLVHRDLKPGNILINKKERLIKIGDFGLSARINDEIQYGKIGTPSYIAPQIIEKRPIRKEELHLIDVYSIGVIFYELLNLFNVTTKHEKLHKINKLKEGKVDLLADFNLEKKLIRMMTKSTNRLSINEIFERKQYIELSNLVRQDTGIIDSWENVSGLEQQVP